MQSGVDSCGISLCFNAFNFDQLRFLFTWQIDMSDCPMENARAVVCDHAIVDAATAEPFFNTPLILALWWVTFDARQDIPSISRSKFWRACD